MKDYDLMYFAFAFIVGMLIHYNMKEMCKGRGFLLEGSENSSGCSWTQKNLGWFPYVDGCPSTKSTTTPPEACKTLNPNCRPGSWWNSDPVKDGYCKDPKSTKSGSFCWF